MQDFKFFKVYNKIGLFKIHTKKPDAFILKIKCQS